MEMIDKIVNIAYEAGSILRDKFRKELRIEYKGSFSNMVTEADKLSENRIIDFIRKEFPTHGILAEESGGMSTDAEFLWVIDPLDGTTNFAHGLPLFSVSIGLQRNGKTIAGVIYHVMDDAMYTAELGGGAFCNNRRIFVSKTDDLRKSLLVTGFPYDISSNPHNAFQILVEMIKESRGMRRLGSAAIDFCYLADGVFEGFWEVHLHPWDMCAGMLLVSEAGGTTTDFQGVPATIYSKQILSTNTITHPEMLALIQRASQMT
jgi:myo-inositol-1(or 4)-monophosphatase